MRTRTILLVLVLGAVAVLVAFAVRMPKAPSKAGETSATSTAYLQIEGMSCYACVARVQRALERTNGVAGVNLSLETRCAKVRYDPAVVTPDTLAQVVTSLGYRAASVVPSGAR